MITGWSVRYFTNYLNRLDLIKATLFLAGSAYRINPDYTPQIVLSHLLPAFDTILRLSKSPPNEKGRGLQTAGL